MTDIPFIVCNLIETASSGNEENRIAFLLGRVFPHVEIEELFGLLNPSLEMKEVVGDLLLIHPSGAQPVDQLVEAIRERWKQSPLVVLLDSEQLRQLNETVRLFDDFVVSPLRDAEVHARLVRFLPAIPEKVVAGSKRDVSQSIALEPLVGESSVFMRVLERAILLAQTDGTVLITGETGTGKDLIARAIHSAGERRDKPFVPVNCGALPEHLVESELFGCVKGAFTGATETRTGLIAEAEGGTLFLDEIDTLSLAIQVKLLRFVQDRNYRPVGYAKSRYANVRVIAATNADLKQLVEQKSFREDLFFRLNVLPIQLPPLRDRVEDIPLLATYFVGKHAERRTIGAPALSPGALQKLMAYTWPGNVRELEVVIQRGLLLSPLLPLLSEGIEVPVSPFGKPCQGTFLREAKAQAIGQFERLYLVNLLATHQGNVSQAAKTAGKERRTFQRLLSKHGLQSIAFREHTSRSIAD